jgi:hypothetical protein
MLAVWGKPVTPEVQPPVVPSVGPTKIPAFNQRSDHKLRDLPQVAITKAPPIIEWEPTATPVPTQAPAAESTPIYVIEPNQPVPVPEVTVIPIRPKGPVECPPPLLSGPADKNTDELICLHTPGV